MIGKRLGHYQITEKLGQGGMGVVYRARDAHLDRPAAIKVLPAERVADPDRKRRFVKEAKAASALNHPNIVHVYDIDQAEGTDYIAMEYVDGKTLDHLIPRKGMRLNEALKYAVQIADALAAAHAAGIIHRDLKPANVMVTDKGLVKLLDFGLAKLTEAAASLESRMTEPMEPGTEEGAIIGTVAYMSPEQAEGKAIDARSDIFSFGSMIYEMLTGQRAFRGESRASTLAAILREEPKALSQVVPELPHEVERVVRRCLRKDAEHRFQTMADLRVALEELQEESDSGALKGGVVAVPRAGRSWFGYASVAALLLLIAIIVLYPLRREPKPETPLTVVPLTSYPGMQQYPSLSPDGREVAFSWNGEKHDNVDIYVQMVSGGPPQRLTTDPAPDLCPQWSPDGNQIAFVREGVAYLISPRGGSERRLCSAGAVPVVWNPDGKYIGIADRDEAKDLWAFFLVSVDTGRKQRMHLLPENTFLGARVLFFFAFAPNARHLLFARSPSGLSIQESMSALIGATGNNDVYLLPLDGGAPKGEARPLTNDSKQILGLAWTPDSQEVVFCSTRGGRPSLWRMPVEGGKEPERIPGTDDGFYPAISKGPPIRLAYQRPNIDTNIWRMAIPDMRDNINSPTQIIASSALERDPQFSPDGKRIAFASTRSGYSEIWLAGGDGSNQIQLTSFAGKRTAGAPSWSPDSRQIAFDSGARSGNYDIFVIDVETRVFRQITAEPLFQARPSWSRDGRWIYFVSDKSGSHQIWKVSAEGGTARQVTKDGGFEAQEGPDGKVLCYTKSWSKTPGVWSVPVDGGEEIPIIKSAMSGYWSIADKGIYFLDFDAVPASAAKPLKFFSFETRKITQVGVIEKIQLTGDASFSVSRNGRWVIWRQLDRSESNIMLIDNFR